MVKISSLFVAGAALFTVGALPFIGLGDGTDATARKYFDPDHPALMMFRLIAEKSPPADLETVEAFRLATVERLLKNFDARLENPGEYRELVLRECAAFPEGDIYSYAIPALAYANLAIANQDARHHSQAQMVKLIDLAVACVNDRLKPPNGDLLRLAHYREQGTYLSTLYLTLATYAWIGGDGRYEKLRSHLSKLLRDALIEGEGKSIRSYPEYFWHFDTVFLLTARHLDDQRLGEDVSRELIASHLDWKARHTVHAPTGLPEAYPGSLPRGCDLSLLITLTSQFAPETAAELYRKYVQHHWLDYGFAAGFSEFPVGFGEPVVFGGDIDSGPVVMDIGLTATGMAMTTTKALNDNERFNTLNAELRKVPSIIQALSSLPASSEVLGWHAHAEAPLNSGYFSGFLFGDIMMFYALTWVPYQNKP